MSDVYTGLCVGGPLNGQEVTVRTPDGFLAADRSREHAWLYKRNDDGVFAVCLRHDDSTIYPYGASSGLRTLDPDRAVGTVLGGGLDVIAVPEER
ncbi:MAG: hypothetical protein ABWY93_02920 [Mycobacterium sp.]